MKVGCTCAKHDASEGRYYCDVTGDHCDWMIPDAITCARVYGEGPLSDRIIQDDELYYYRPDLDRIEKLQEDVMDLALAAMREKEARERPEALTIEQVLDKLRTGDPIWLKIIHRDIAKWTFLVTRRKNASGNDVCVFWDYVEETWLDILDYTKTWLAYAHRPGEAGE